MAIIQKKPDKITEKNKVLKSAKKLSDARHKIINFYEGFFLYNDKIFKKKKKKEKSEEKEELDENKFFKYIEIKSKSINYELFEKHFNNVVPTALAKELFKTKDKNKNIKFVNMINSGLRDIKDEIEKMSKEEIEIEKPNEILDIVEKILEFSEKIQSVRGLKY